MDARPFDLYAFMDGSAESVQESTVQFAICWNGYFLRPGRGSRGAAFK